MWQKKDLDCASNFNDRHHTRVPWLVYKEKYENLDVVMRTRSNSTLEAEAEESWGLTSLGHTDF